jgi:hypothetical protein
MGGVTTIRIAVCAGALAFLASCEEMPVNSSTNAAAIAPTPVPGYWNGDGVSGSPKIVVSIAEQRAYFYKGKELVGESTVSTGKPGFGTPPGSYTVLSKDPTHVSSVFGDYVDDFGNVVKSNIDSRKDSKPPGSHYDGARMPFAMFFRGGYAMHQGYVPPYAASHGCIRLPHGMAEIFFNASPPGTPVIVKQDAVMHRVVTSPEMPASTTMAPPASNLLQSSAPPPPVRPAVVRSTVPAPSPIPLRTPAPVVSRAPAPGTCPFRSPSPAPVRSPAPGVVRTTVPPPTLRPVPVPSPSPVVVSARPASVQPTPSPSPVRSRKKAHTRSKTHRRAPNPSPTPTPTPAR